MNRLEEKRNQKFKHKENFECISSFIKTLPTLKLNTMINYIQIISNFMSFSPKCEIDDYIKYLKLKSKLTWDESLDDFDVKGTNVKHANILRRFLIFNHHKDIPKVKLEYYKTPKRVDINPYPKLSRKKYISTIRYYLIIKELERQLCTILCLH